MPLQIRRGTETERLAMTQKLAAGEPLWITTTSKLYIGDGVTSTPTLLPVTGFTSSDAQDAAASLFTTATHSGISFTYDTIANTLTAQVNLSDYNGTIKASSFNGSIVANDSTLIINGETGTVLAERVSGTFTGSVIGNVTGNTSGTHTGAVIGNVTGNVTGDVYGSIFANDSTLVFDAIDSVLAVRKIRSSSSTLDIGTTTDPLVATFFSNNTSELANFKGITNGTTLIPFVNIRTSKGTLANPTTTAINDVLTGLNFQGYANGDYQSAGAIYAQWESTATLTDPNPASKITIATGNNAGGSTFMTFDSVGKLTVPNISTTGLIYRTINYIAVGSTTTYALSTTVSFNVLVIASTGYTATLTLPPSPADGQMVSFTVAGNTVTLAMTAGPTVVPAFAGAGIVSGTVYRYVYRSSNTTWYRH
jgi:hypothetical protein